MNRDTTSQTELFCIIISEFINREIAKFNCTIKNIYIEKGYYKNKKLYIIIEMINAPDRFLCNIICEADHLKRDVFTNRTLRKKDHIKQLSNSICDFVEKEYEKTFI